LQASSLAVNVTNSFLKITHGSISPLTIQIDILIFSLNLIVI